MPRRYWHFSKNFALLEEVRAPLLTMRSGALLYICRIFCVLGRTRLFPLMGRSRVKLTPGIERLWMRCRSCPKTTKLSITTPNTPSFTGKMVTGNPSLGPQGPTATREWVPESENWAERREPLLTLRYPQFSVHPGYSMDAVRHPFLTDTECFRYLAGASGTTARCARYRGYDSQRGGYSRCPSSRCPHHIDSERFVGHPLITAARCRA